VTRSFVAFAARRIVAAVVLVFVVSTGAFVLTRLAPGDALGDRVLTDTDAAAIARTRHRLGLDRPVLTQLGEWTVGLVHFNLGRSLLYETPVAPLAAEHAANTARLAAVALAIALVGLPIGVLTGAHPEGWLARVVTPVSVVLVSCPPIVGALLLLWFALVTGWLSTSPGSLAVPALALALPLAATLERLQSQAIVDALRSPDIVAAAARGLSPSRILWRHALRQSLGPVLGIGGVLIGGLFSGSLAVEVVSGWPGIGSLTFAAIGSRDMPLVAGCVFIGALVLAVSNLGADLLRGLVDPRASLV
jgi:ABC-type dipeptide/oligopeptide/nickel transport system permease component